MAFYKTIIQVEVLSDGRYEWDGLMGVVRDITLGDVSGQISEVSSEEISIDDLIAECDKHGTDPEFFLGEKLW